jgi:hypothetical protein
MKKRIDPKSESRTREDEAKARSLKEKTPKKEIKSTNLGYHGRDDEKTLNPEE